MEIVAQLSEDYTLEFVVKAKLYDAGKVDLEEYRELFRRLAAKYGFAAEDVTITFTGQVVDKKTLQA